ncbi:hypothetical protein SH1V18_39860 [Vallitalea longa]|uniref:Uncharacterized protein n=1 Tax=Vallitalea longa TaxID=2936439 RepID=A0A9W5YF27_9FIRM|nr:extracellular solute-binding protein [Vallitalea longa]GKX31506.1 hypothetical protein SH1V18_39860 [Vallitalea longa]
MKKLLEEIVLIILIIALVGCSTNDKEISHDKREEPIKISIAFWNIDNALSGGDNDKMLKQIKEDLNIEIVPYEMTFDDYKRKIQLWASSSRYPDIMAIDAIGTPLYYTWINKKIIKPLPEDLSLWPNLNSYMNSSGMETFKNCDGKFYLIPRKTYDSTHSVKLSGMDRKIYYRYDLAEKAGIIKEPENYDEFRNMIKAIMKANFENKNIEGMTVKVPYILDSFFMCYSVPLGMSDGSGNDYKWVKKDGKYIPAYFAGDIKAALQLARDMFEEKTLARDVTLAKEQQSIGRFVNGSCAAFLANMPTVELAEKWNEYYDDKKFEDCVKILSPLESIDGNVYGNVYKKFWSESYITTSDPVKYKAILDLYEYFLKNENMLRMGYEGEDYIAKNGVQFLKPNEKINEKYPITLLANLVQWNNISRYLTLTGDPEKDKYFKMDVEYSYKLLNTELPEYKEINISEEAQSMCDFSIKPADDMIKVMVGKESVDKMYDDLMKYYENQGLSKVIEEFNTWVDEEDKEK